MTNSNPSSPLLSETKPTGAKPSSNKLIIVITIIIFLLISCSIGVVLIFIFLVSPTNISSDLYQTCLNSPNSKGCEDCRINGDQGNICNRCENLNQLVVKNEPFSGNDEVYFKEYCSDPVTDIESYDPIPLTPPAQSGITLFGNQWPAFNYSLPTGGKISGVAPIFHAFGTDYGTSSLLGNSIGFSFDSFDDQGITNVEISIVYSEGIYAYYEEAPEIVALNRGLYRITRPATTSISYTDSYEKDKCAEYVSSYISEPTLAGICGTEMLFDHTYLATCEYEGDIEKAIVMCDEFFKNLAII